MYPQDVSEPTLVVPPPPYTTDERIYQVSSVYFMGLIPPGQVTAEGVDGATLAGSEWVVHSASNDFAAQGVSPGMMFVITGPRAFYGTDQEVYVVDSLVDGDAHAVTLRRVGVPSGAGMSPGPSGGITGIIFSVPTLMPQIRSAGAEVDARWRIGVNGWRQRTQMDPFSMTMAENLCIHMVLHQQFIGMARTFNEIGSGQSTFVGLAREHAAEVQRIQSSFAPRFYTPERNPTRRRSTPLFRT